MNSPTCTSLTGDVHADSVVPSKHSSNMREAKPTPDSKTEVRPERDFKLDSVAVAAQSRFEVL